MAIPFLYITGLIFVLIGAYGLYDPAGAMLPIGLRLDTLASLNQMRGSAGGVPLVLGGLMLWACRRDDLERAALAGVVVVLGGLELGRWVSIVVDGVPPGIIWFYMALETLGLVQAAFLLRANLAAGKD